MKRCPRIVLTGGPGGGKTTFMRELHANDRRTKRWIFVPEAAPLLFRAGLSARNKSFQQAVVQLQIALEDICANAADSNQVLICHRGTLDPLAYWLRNGWEEEEFFAITGMDRLGHYRRYYGVIHLQTAAINAEEQYQHWPEAHRPETPIQATEIDLLCARVWHEHPRYLMIDNLNRSWIAKSRSAHELLDSWFSQRDK